jgi:hypothetical protein
VALVAGASLLVGVGLVLGGVHVAGVGAAPPAPGPALPTHQTARPAAPPPSGKLAGLDNKQIRARIEAAHYTILQADEREQTSTWTIPGTSLTYVQMSRLRDARTAEMFEQSLVNQPGVVVREGTIVLHVRMAQPDAARALLAQINR